jgi:hypothetical protein
VELALGHRPFSEEDDGDLVPSRQLVGQGEADGEGRPPPTMALPP